LLLILQRSQDNSFLGLEPHRRRRRLQWCRAIWLECDEHSRCPTSPVLLRQHVVASSCDRRRGAPQGRHVTSDGSKNKWSRAAHHASRPLTTTCASEFAQHLAACHDSCAATLGRRTWAALTDDGVVHLAGSVVENPHGLRLSAFKFSPKGRRIVCTNVVGRPQMGQKTSLVGVTSSLIVAADHAQALCDKLPLSTARRFNPLKSVATFLRKCTAVFLLLSKTHRSFPTS
jgi:hypothetical protein